MTKRLDRYVGRQLTRLYQTEQGLADEFRRVSERHSDEVDIAPVCELLARQCVTHVDLLGSHLEQYAGHRPSPGPERHRVADSLRGFLRRRVAGTSPQQGERESTLLDELGNLYLAITAADLLWVQVGQAASALSDSRLLATVSQRNEQTTAQLTWLKTQINQLAPRTPTVGGHPPDRA